VEWIEARIRELLEKHPNSDAHGTIRVGIRDPLETALDCPQWSPLSRVPYLSDWTVKTRRNAVRESILDGPGCYKLPAFVAKKSSGAATAPPSRQTVETFAASSPVIARATAPSVVARAVVPRAQVTAMCRCTPEAACYVSKAVPVLASRITLEQFLVSPTVLPSAASPRSRPASLGCSPTRSRPA
jgi:hypothetical protein